jgi:hypothetical protein
MIHGFYMTGLAPTTPHEAVDQFQVQVQGAISVGALGTKQGKQLGLRNGVTAARNVRQPSSFGLSPFTNYQNNGLRKYLQSTANGREPTFTAVARSSCCEKLGPIAVPESSLQRQRWLPVPLTDTVEGWGKLSIGNVDSICAAAGARLRPADAPGPRLRTHRRISAHNSTHGVTCAVSSGNAARRVFLV